MLELKEEMYASKAILSIAPMIDVSNTHFRYFIRLMTKRATIYTEMLHHDAVINNHSFLLPFNFEEHPIVLQLGGCDPSKLAEAAILGEKYGYDEINLNVGCPSPRVQKGSFGACLMKEPDLVYECMEEVSKRVKIPCTVKCRLGVDEFDSYEFARDFVKVVSANGQGHIKHFVIHARKAFLNGLSPAQNRNVPPLHYDRVERLRKQFPKLKFEINGGIKTIQQGKDLVDNYDLSGCMIGRAAYENTFQIIKTDEIFYGDSNYHDRYKTKNDNQIRKIIMHQYADYVERLERGEVKDAFGNLIHKPNPSVLVKPLLTLYNGEKNCAKFRQFLSDFAKLKSGSLFKTIKEAVILMETINHYQYNQQGQDSIKQQIPEDLQKLIEQINISKSRSKSPEKQEKQNKNQQKLKEEQKEMQHN